MKIICDYCGHRFESSKNDRCPGCGASIAGNKEIQREMERESLEKDLDLKSRELSVKAEEMGTEFANSIFKSFKRSQKISVFIFFLVFVVFGFITFLIINGNKDFIDINSNKKVEAIYPDVAVTKKYKFSVSNYKDIDNAFTTLEKKEGYKVVTFHLMLENNGDSEYHPKDSVQCIVDGELMERFLSVNDKIFSYFDVLNKGMKVSADYSFYVPIDSNSCDIVYENAIIHILK